MCLCHHKFRFAINWIDETKDVDRNGATNKNKINSIEELCKATDHRDGLIEVLEESLSVPINLSKFVCSQLFLKDEKIKILEPASAVNQQSTNLVMRFLTKI